VFWVSIAYLQQAPIKPRTLDHYIAILRIRNIMGNGILRMFHWVHQNKMHRYLNATKKATGFGEMTILNVFIFAIKWNREQIYGET
jgi:hypothetical protein